uniref:Phospholipid-translocating P-type ATPase domain protein n=1 Tax=Toxoplasma gondii COUG TaxID=1074873 RepID=A0A2G8XNL6_TOXGO|nr:phospholipid-translocating P-type ATPase domain protein [Toxoplasma gondii COUG]
MLLFCVVAQISGTGGLPTIGMPLSVVLICNGVKDAVEDYRRHQADDVENGQICQLVGRGPPPASSSPLVSLRTRLFHFLCPRRSRASSSPPSSPSSARSSARSSAPSASPLSPFPWESVELGDIVVCFRDDFFPADLLLLASADPNGVAFIETAGLDGEGNMKVKQLQKDLALWIGHQPHAANLSASAGTRASAASPPAALLAALQEIGTLSGSLCCDWPNRDLLRCDGILTVSRRRRQEPARGNGAEEEAAAVGSCRTGDASRVQRGDAHGPNGDSEERQVPVNIDNMLLRGCRLRNTDWIVGLAVYTGDNTKIQLVHRFTKRSENSVHYFSPFMIQNVYPINGCISSSIYLLNVDECV